MNKEKVEKMFESCDEKNFMNFKEEFNAVFTEELNEQCGELEKEVNEDLTLIHVNEEDGSDESLLEEVNEFIVNESADIDGLETTIMKISGIGKDGKSFVSAGGSNDKKFLAKKIKDMTKLGFKDLKIVKVDLATGKLVK